MQTVKLNNDYFQIVTKIYTNGYLLMPFYGKKYTSQTL